MGKVKIVLMAAKVKLFTDAELSDEIHMSIDLFDGITRNLSNIDGIYKITSNIEVGGISFKSGEMLYTLTKGNKTYIGYPGDERIYILSVTNYSAHEIAQTLVKKGLASKVNSKYVEACKLFIGFEGTRYLNYVNPSIVNVDSKSKRFLTSLLSGKLPKSFKTPNVDKCYRLISLTEEQYVSLRKGGSIKLKKESLSYWSESPTYFNPYVRDLQEESGTGYAALLETSTKNCLLCTGSEVLSGMFLNDAKRSLIIHEGTGIVNNTLTKENIKKFITY